jgi:hypothetical protein
MTTTTTMTTMTMTTTRRTTTMSSRRSYSFSLVSALADRVFIDTGLHPEHRRRFRATTLSPRPAPGDTTDTSASTSDGRSS